MIDTAIKKEMYNKMLRLRMVEEKISEIYHFANEMKTPTHLYTGQEAVAVGVCQNLTDADSVSPYHRSHGWYLAKGGDLKSMMAELFGKETGCCQGWGGSMHLIDVAAGVMGSSSILAGTIPHAVGCALAFQIKGLKQVAIAPCGDAAVEEGVFYESLNWAVLKQLPVVFICENNLYSTSTHIRARQPAVDIYQRVASVGIPSQKIDGNDVLQVYAAAQAAVKRARAGQGPSFIEASTYRWREHVGPYYDYDLGYRSKEELDKWMQRCPIQKLEQEFPEYRKEAEATIRLEIEGAIAFARESAFPGQEVLS
jgi:TPP-dependent pyruvate/acetoin dehydrogenase alpha subunit